jgi:hypothetical protein
LVFFFLQAKRTNICVDFQFEDKRKSFKMDPRRCLFTVASLNLPNKIVICDFNCFIIIFFVCFSFAIHNLKMKTKMDFDNHPWKHENYRNGIWIFLFKKLLQEESFRMKNKNKAYWCGRKFRYILWCWENPYLLKVKRLTLSKAGGRRITTSQNSLFWHVEFYF